MLKIKAVHFVFLLLIIILNASCSTTKVSVQNAAELKGKKIAIGNISIVAANRSKRSSTDTICACTEKSTQDALIPFLQQAGLRVINLPVKRFESFSETMALADSLQIDYLLTGNGLVDLVGKSTFMRELNIKAFATNTREIVIAATFTGTSVTPVKAASKIGEQIVNKTK